MMTSSDIQQYLNIAENWFKCRILFGKYYGFQKTAMEVVPWSGCREDVWPRSSNIFLYEGGKPIKYLLLIIE